METKMISTNIANGTIHYSDRSESITAIKWDKHPKFKGVYLKHIIKSVDTGGLFSSHLVRIDPKCCLENQQKLHEVKERNHDQES